MSDKRYINVSTVFDDTGLHQEFKAENVNFNEVMSASIASISKNAIEFDVDRVEVFFGMIQCLSDEFDDVLRGITDVEHGVSEMLKQTIN